MITIYELAENRVDDLKEILKNWKDKYNLLPTFGGVTIDISREVPITIKYYGGIADSDNVMLKLGEKGIFLERDEYNKIEIY